MEQEFTEFSKFRESDVSCRCCGSILVSRTRGGWVAGSNPFPVMTNIFSLNSGNSKKTFRENLNGHDTVKPNRFAFYVPFVFLKL